MKTLKRILEALGFTLVAIWAFGCYVGISVMTPKKEKREKR
jgi:hypothetical protein